MVFGHMRVLPGDKQQKQPDSGLIKATPYYMIITQPKIPSPWDYIAYDRTPIMAVHSFLNSSPNVTVIPLLELFLFPLSLSTLE
jgi:hypothetical protein